MKRWQTNGGKRIRRHNHGKPDAGLILNRLPKLRAQNVVRKTELFRIAARSPTERKTATEMAMANDAAWPRRHQARHSWLKQISALSASLRFHFCVFCAFPLAIRRSLRLKLSASSVVFIFLPPFFCHQLRSRLS